MRSRQLVDKARHWYSSAGSSTRGLEVKATATYLSREGAPSSNLPKVRQEPGEAQGQEQEGQRTSTQMAVLALSYT